MILITKMGYTDITNRAGQHIEMKLEVLITGDDIQRLRNADKSNSIKVVIDDGKEEKQ